MAKRLWRTLPRWVAYDDIESDALLGLLKAARSFDPSQGTPFSSFASKRIHGAMIDGIRERLGRWLASRRPRLASLDAPVFDGKPSSRVRTIADPAPSGQIAVDQRDEVEFVLGHVAPSDRKVLRSYFLDGYTHREIAQCEHRTRDCIGWRLHGAVNRVREAFATHSGGCIHG